MPYLTDLADAVRKSGLTVIEEPGWKTRGHGPMSGVRSVMCHHTAGGSDTGDRRVVRDGRPGLAGPLSQILLETDGTVRIIAAGRCYHAGPTHQTKQQNSFSIGIEAVHRGTSPISGVQLEAYVRLVAALIAHYRLGVTDVFSHAEAAKPTGRKADILNNMRTFRASVAALSGAKPAAAPSAPSGPATIAEDGLLGLATIRLWARYLGASAPSRAEVWAGDPRFVKAAQSWLGREQTGTWGRTHTRSLQTKVGAQVDGIWGTNTALGLQRWLNRRVRDGSLK